MKEQHGVPNATKLRMSNDGCACVLVTDGDELVHLHLENATWGAGLTPQQARWIAQRLISSAIRVEAGLTK